MSSKNRACGLIRFRYAVLDKTAISFACMTNTFF